MRVHVSNGRQESYAPFFEGRSLGAWGVASLPLELYGKAVPYFPTFLPPIFFFFPSLLFEWTLHTFLPPFPLRVRTPTIFPIDPPTFSFSLLKSGNVDCPKKEEGGEDWGRSRSALRVHNNYFTFIESFPSSRKKKENHSCE